MAEPTALKEILERVVAELIFKSIFYESEDKSDD